MKNSLGFYEFIYGNGFIQEKELIDLKSFQYYTLLIQQRSELQNNLSGKNKKNIELNIELANVNKLIKEFKHEFFVVGSPMYKAIELGYIEIPDDMGNAGRYNVKISKIETIKDSDNND